MYHKHRKRTEACSWKKVVLKSAWTKENQKPVPVAKISVFSWSISEPKTVIISRWFSFVVYDGYFLRMKWTKNTMLYTNKEVNYETTRDCCLIYDLTNHLRNIIVKIWKENNCSWNLKNNTKLKIQIKCRLLIQPNRTRFFMIIYENSCMQLLMVKQR